MNLFHCLDCNNYAAVKRTKLNTFKVMILIITLKKESIEELVSFYVGVRSKVSPCYLIAISDA